MICIGEFSVFFFFSIELDIRVILLGPDPGSNPGPLDCKSEALPTELCGPLSIFLFKDVYEPNDVSNDVILMIIRLSVN